MFYAVYDSADRHHRSAVETIAGQLSGFYKSKVFILPDALEYASLQCSALFIGGDALYPLMPFP
jgi:hypothetical protein